MTTQKAICVLCEDLVEAVYVMDSGDASFDLLEQLRDDIRLAGAENIRIQSVDNLSLKSSESPMCSIRSSFLQLLANRILKDEESK